MPNQIPPELLDLPELEILSPESDISSDADADPGFIIDQEVEPEPLISPDRPTRVAAKNTAPNANEWLDFFSRIVLKFGTDWYISFAFRGIDDSIISDKDLSRLRLTEDERKRIAVPFAEFTNKTKWGKKYGRTVLSASDSFESLVTLGIWYARVNRIASKYRPKKEKKQNVSTGETAQHDDGYARITVVPGSGA